MKISENPEISGQPKISGNFGNIQKFGKPEISENLEISGIFSYLKKGTYFKKQCPLVGRSSKKIFYCFFLFLTRKKCGLQCFSLNSWVKLKMFSMLPQTIHILSLLKTKKNRRKFFWENYQ